MTEELKLREYDRSVLGNLTIEMGVWARNVAGGFDEQGKWVVRYAVERYEADPAIDRMIYENSKRAIDLWSISIREYAEKYNCTCLKRLVLSFMGYAVKGGNYDVLIRVGSLSREEGIYISENKTIVIDRFTIKWYPKSVFRIISHQIGHSLGLGHYVSETWQGGVFIDSRGNEFSFDRKSLTLGGLPSTMELYALCQLFRPLEYHSPPRLLEVVKLPNNLREEFMVGVGLVQVFLVRVRGNELVVEPPMPAHFQYSPYAKFNWNFGISEAHLNSSGIGLKGSNLILYPLRRYCNYTVWMLVCGGYVRYRWVTYDICGIKEPYVVTNVWGNGTMEAVAAFKIYRVVYEKIYIYNGSGLYKMYLLNNLKGFKQSGLEDLKYIVILRGEECEEGKCYDSVEWMDDGRILLSNVKEDLLIRIDLDKLYTFSIDTGPFNYNYTVIPRKYLNYTRALLVLRIVGPLNNTYAPRGSEIYLKLKDTVNDFGNGTRLAIAGWNVGSWNGTHLKVLLDRPVEIKALIRKEHLVSVESAVGSFTNTGWIPEGSSITIRPEEEIVDFGNGTRMVFRGFEGYNGKSLTLTITSPVKLKALWTKQHLTSLESRYIRSSAEWFDDGDIFIVTLRKEIDFGNGTIARLRSITAYVGNETFEAGHYGEVMKLMLKVGRPATVKAQWDVYHMISISSEAPVESSSPGLHLEGSKWNATAEESIVYGNGTMRKFIGWLVNGQLIKDRRIELTVLKPLDIKALWSTYYHLTFMLNAGGGYIVRADKVTLESEHGAVVVNGSGFVERGVWRVLNAWYKSVEVSLPAEVLVKEPGTVTIPSMLRTVKVKVVDSLGMPAPNTLIITSFSQAVTNWAGEALLYAIPPTVVKVDLKHMLGESSTVIQGEAAETMVRIPVSIYTLITVITILLITLAVYLGLKRLR
jgi:hypothetical protein